MIFESLVTPLVLIAVCIGVGLFLGSLLTFFILKDEIKRLEKINDSLMHYRDLFKEKYTDIN